MAVKDWSTTASSNTGILSGITLDGAIMTPPQVDNAFREMAAQIAAQLGKMGFEGAGIASAATTDLATATGWSLNITGTTTITSFGTVNAGQMFILRFTGAATLTHNATSLILPGGANITTAANDVAFMKSEGSGNWRCLAYFKANGRPVVDIEQISVTISVPTDKTYTLARKMTFSGTVLEVTTKSSSGTCTLTGKIDGVSLGGTPNSVSSVEQSQAQASANTFTAGQDLQATVSSNSACVDMDITWKIQRTG
jgi:hypothetical protein